MAALLVSIIANVSGKEIPWQDLSPEYKKKIATKLNNDAMRVAGYEAVPNKVKVPEELEIQTPTGT